MVWVLWKVCGFNHVLHIGQEVHNLHGVVLNRHQRWFSIFQGRLQAVTELGKGFGALVDFLTTDILSWVFALVIILKQMLSDEEFRLLIYEIGYELDILDGKVESVPQSKILNSMGFPENFRDIINIEGDVKL